MVIGDSVQTILTKSLVLCYLDTQFYAPDDVPRTLRPFLTECVTPHNFWARVVLYTFDAK